MDFYRQGDPLLQPISCCDHVLFHHSCIQCRSMNIFFGCDDLYNARPDIIPRRESSKKFQNRPNPQTSNTPSQDIQRDMEVSAPSFCTSKGEVVQLLSENIHAAILEDPCCPGARFGPFPVQFAPYFLELTDAVDCRQCLAHVIPVMGHDRSANEKVIFVGDIGLLGGGQLFPKPHSCDDYPKYRCPTCIFQCPNDKCEKCCTHKSHTCLAQQTRKKEIKKKHEKSVSEEVRSAMQDVSQHLFDGISIEEVDRTEVNDQETEGQDLVFVDPQEMEQMNENVNLPGTNSQPSRTVPENGHLPFHHQHDTFPLAVKCPLIIPLWGKILAKYSLEQSWPSTLHQSEYIKQDIEIFRELGIGQSDDEKTILTKIWNCKSINIHLKLKFKVIWAKMTDVYSCSTERVQFLKHLLELTRKQSWSLTNLCDIIRAVLEMKKYKFNFIFSNFNLLELRRDWLLKKCLTNNPKMWIIVEKLAQSFWGLDMCRIFMNVTQEEKNVEELLCFLDQVLDFGTPEAMVLQVMTSDVKPDQRKSKIGTWMNLIMFQVLCNILGSSRSEIENIAPSLFKLVQISFSPTVLFLFIRDNSKEIVENVSVFTEVCEIMVNYRVSKECGEKVLKEIRSHPVREWVSRTDRKILSHIFPNASDYDMTTSTQALIKKIVCDTDFLEEKDEEKLLSEYLKVMKIYNNPLTDITEEALKACPVSSWKEKEVQKWAKLVKTQVIQEDTFQSIAVLQRAIELNFNGKTLRTVQVLALLILLQPKVGIGRLAQINTGEGKTIIVAILAAVHALRGKKVDIVTTSRDLATKAAEEMKAFYNMLTLKVSHNSSSDLKDVKNAYNCDVLYGITLDFLGDTLRTEFLGNDVRSGRKFDMVIVDELDSLLYDDRMCKIRMSQVMPGMNYLEPVLGAIWQNIHFLEQRIIKKEKRKYYIDDEYYLDGDKVILKSGAKEEEKMIEIDDPTKFIIDETMKHIEKLIKLRSDKELKEFEEYQKLEKEMFEKHEALDEEAREKNQEYKELKKKLEDHPCTKDPENHYPVLNIPSHLHDFAMYQIPLWVKNAVHAASEYQKDAHYTVKDNRIVPIYYDENGELQQNMVWSDGLAQYLQMKEGLPVDAENVPTNFLSHISFFKRYIPNIHGVTGTMGVQTTKDFLCETFAVDLTVIPPHRSREILDNHNSPYLCKELLTLIVGNEAEWYSYVVAHALHHAKLKRAVLIICRFIYIAEKIVEFLSRESKNDKSLKIHKFTGVSTFEKRNVDCGDMIVSTNISGRGADFITSPQVEKNGGLYVAITFLPKSLRVELQNAGRTGRQGKRGLAQLIIYHPKITDINELKKIRDKHEDDTCTRAKEDVKNVLQQDELFNKFCSLESKLLPDMSQIEKEMKFNKLQSEWQEYSFKNKLVLKDRILFFRESIKKKLEEQRSFARKEDSITNKQEMRNTEIKKQLDEQVVQRTAECEIQLLQKFCFTRGERYPADIIECLKEGKEYVSQKSELATKYNWGRFERLALEERWALWLRARNFESGGSQEEAFDEFKKQIEKDAKKDELIKNPFFYILKGNDFLNQKMFVSGSNVMEQNKLLDKAVECYSKAIKLDTTFSAHARYNKACALLSYKWNQEKQVEAGQELDAALNVIEKTLRPTLSAFLAMLASTNKLEEKTVKHIEHQLNITEQQKMYINKAKEVLASTATDKLPIQLTRVPMMKALELSSEDHSAAIREEYTNGLTHFFSLEIRHPVQWFNVILLSVIGCVQIVMGCVMICVGSVAGIALAMEGISDLILAVTSAFTGTFAWGKWMIFKGASLVISILSAGARAAVAAGRAVGRGVMILKNHITGVEVATKYAGCAIQLVQQSENTAPCFTLAECMTRERNIYDNFENQILSLIKKELTKFVSENALLVNALDLDFRQGNEYWTQIFLEKASKLFSCREFQKKESQLKTMIRKEIKRSVRSGTVDNIPETLRKELKSIMSSLLTSFENEISIYKNEITNFQRTGKEQGVSSSNCATYSPEIEVSIDADSDSSSEEQRRNSNHIDDSNVARKVALFPVRQSLNEKFIFKLCCSISQRYCSEFRQEFLKLVNKPEMSILRKNIITENKAKLQEFQKFIEDNFKNTGPYQSQTKPDENPDTSPDQGSSSELIDVVTEGFNWLLKHTCAPFRMLHWLAPALKKPILVFESQTGRLIDVEENENAFDPILVKLVHIQCQSLIRYYVPLSDSVVVASESESSFLDAVWAQVDSRVKKSKNLNDLKKEVIRKLAEDPLDEDETLQRED